MITFGAKITPENAEYNTYQALQKKYKLPAGDIYLCEDPKEYAADLADLAIKLDANYSENTRIHRGAKVSGVFFIKPNKPDLFSKLGTLVKEQLEVKLPDDPELLGYIKFKNAEPWALQDEKLTVVKSTVSWNSDYKKLMTGIQKLADSFMEIGKKLD